MRNRVRVLVVVNQQGAAIAVFLSVLAAASSAISAEVQLVRGKDVVLNSQSHRSPYAVVFEDNGETGYFYAIDDNNNELTIVDSLHIYDVDSKRSPGSPSTAKVIWSDDGLKAALLLDDYTHAVFDFSRKRGYCRTGFPDPRLAWSPEGHQWDESVLKLFDE